MSATSNSPTQKKRGAEQHATGKPADESASANHSKNKKAKKEKEKKTKQTFSTEDEGDEGGEQKSTDVAPARYAGKTLYEVLSVQKTATTAEIKRAYRQAALRVHPDHNKLPTANEEFAYLTKAYEVLSDDQGRKAYDQTGSVESEAKSFENAYEYYRRMFPKPTVADIEAFKKQYIGSDMEKQDLAAAFNEHKGDMNLIMQCVPFAESASAERLCALVEQLLAEQSGEAAAGEKKASKGKAKSKSDKAAAATAGKDEAKEGETTGEPKVEIPKLDPKYKRKFNSSRVGLGERLAEEDGSEAEEAKEHAKSLGIDLGGGASSLEAMIKQRQVARAAQSSSWLDKLEQEHSQKAQKKRKR